MKSPTSGRQEVSEAAVAEFFNRLGRYRNRFQNWLLAYAARQWRPIDAVMATEEDLRRGSGGRWPQQERVGAQFDGDGRVIGAERHRTPRRQQ